MIKKILKLTFIGQALLTITLYGQPPAPQQSAGTILNAIGLYVDTLESVKNTADTSLRDHLVTLYIFLPGDSNPIVKLTKARAGERLSEKYNIPLDELIKPTLERLNQRYPTTTLTPAEQAQEDRIKALEKRIQSVREEHQQTLAGHKTLQEQRAALTQALEKAIDRLAELNRQLTQPIPIQPIEGSELDKLDKQIQKQIQDLNQLVYAGTSDSDKFNQAVAELGSLIEDFETAARAAQVIPYILIPLDIAHILPREISDRITKLQKDLESHLPAVVELLEAKAEAEAEFELGLLQKTWQKLNTALTDYEAQAQAQRIPIDTYFVKDVKNLLK